MTASPSIRRMLFPLLALSAVGPLALLLITSLGRDWFAPALWPPRLTLDSWREVVGGGRLGAASRTSFLLALGAGLLGVIAGAPLGRALSMLTGWRRSAGTAAAFLPVAVPPIGLGIGLQVSALAFGLGGSPLGVLASHLLPATGYISLYFLGVFATLDTRIETEARSLGANRWQVLRRILIPILRRPLVDGFLLGFLVSWSQVALTLLIGGGLVRTLPIEVFAYLQAGQDRYAATGALLLVIPPLLLLGAVRLAVPRAQVFQV